MANRIEVEDFISQIDDWRGKEVRYEALGGGITNHNYIVWVNDGSGSPGGAKYVMRIPGEGTELFIDRRREITNYVAAAKTGVAPPLLYLIKPACTIVPFIEGETMHPDAIAGHADRIEAIANAMRTYHDGAVFVDEVRPFQRIRDWTVTCHRSGAPRPAEFDSMHELVDRIEAAMDKNTVGPAACHLDLMPENFILDHHGKMWIIDWEYAAMADPYCDLAKFLVETSLSPLEETAFFNSYHLGKTDERLFARMQLCKLVVDMMGALWGMMQVTLSKLDVGFYEWSMARVARFESHAANPDLERWLEEV